MAKRGRIPIEWLTVANLAVADATQEREVFDLNLDDDEVAEIMAVDSHIRVNITMVDQATRDVEARCMLSMDPTFSTSQSITTEAAMEDLETFFNHMEQIYVEYAEATETGAFSFKGWNQRYVVFPEPIMLANNPSQNVLNIDADRDDTADYITTLYFKRKKATDFELARTLLKRR